MFNRNFGGGRGNRGAGGQGRGAGGGNKPGSGPTGNCICPKCGYKAVHQVGTRCVDLKCPNCGTQLIRE